MVLINNNLRYNNINKKYLRIVFSLIIIITIIFQNNQECFAKEKGKNMDKNGNYKYTNNLINETSPYLLMHAHNPVNWYPWGEETLKRAKEENKLLIISIGYAACHWCHVMEDESYSDEEVAAYMNEHFISIKIDREERPDIDQVYMAVAQLISGSGGWPLNAIAMPDGKPIYAGTYYPKDNWMALLKNIIDIKRKSPEKLDEQVESIMKGIKNSDIIKVNNSEAIFFDDINRVIKENVLKKIDFKLGGFNRAPKFPMPITYEYLLEYYTLNNSKDEKVLEAVTKTLDGMGNGGIYDQIGGGFARYSTDKYWKAPHFEKMLYDNGQLVSLYSHAYQVTKNNRYKEIVYETLEFIERELTSKYGGFFSSLDADSDGEEGKFYVWTKDEFDKVAADENYKELFSKYYNVTKEGNWEHGNNILLLSGTTKQFIKENNLYEETFINKLDDFKKKLLKQRENKIRPPLDDKTLTSWNAIMLKGYIDAYKTFGEKKFLSIALKNANFLNEDLIVYQQDNIEGLFRNFKNGKVSIPAFLDDYALLIDAYISLYQVTFDLKWLKIARELSDFVITHFYDEKDGMFFYTSNLAKELIVRKKEFTDNVIASSNSIMATNLFLLDKFYSDGEKYLEISKKMLNNVEEFIPKGAEFFSKWSSLYLKFTKPFYEVAIIGENYKEKVFDFNKEYIPNTIFLGSSKEENLELLKDKYVTNETTIYVCSNKQCKLPENEVDKALKLIK